MPSPVFNESFNYAVSRIQKCIVLEAQSVEHHHNNLSHLPSTSISKLVPKTFDSNYRRAWDSNPTRPRSSLECYPLYQQAHLAIDGFAFLYTDWQCNDVQGLDLCETNVSGFTTGPLKRITIK